MEVQTGPLAVELSCLLAARAVVGQLISGGFAGRRDYLRSSANRKHPQAGAVRRWGIWGKTSHCNAVIDRTCQTTQRPSRTVPKL